MVIMIEGGGFVPVGPFNMDNESAEYAINNSLALNLYSALSPYMKTDIWAFILNVWTLIQI